MTKHMREGIVPILIVGQTAQMDDETRDKLDTVYDTISYSLKFGIPIFVVGALCLIGTIGIFIAIKVSQRRKVCNCNWP
jgi:hypothetical protein